MKEKKEFIVKCKARDSQSRRYRTINRTVKVDFSEDTRKMFVDASIFALLKTNNKDIFVNKWIQVIDKTAALEDINHKMSVILCKSDRAYEETVSYTVYLGGKHYPFPTKASIELKSISARLPGKYCF